MTPLLKRRITQGRVVLFLGAGASKGSRSKDGKDAAPLGGQLKSELCELSALSDSEDDDLQDVFRASQKILGGHLQPYLEQRYSNLLPPPTLVTLAQFPWARIYTTNIDDATYTALTDHSPQRINPRSRMTASSPINDRLSDLDLVFLNGYIRWPNDGYLFTAQEYARAQAANLPWFKQLVRDFFDYTFLFVGTRLKEPTFYYHIATHTQTTRASIGRSFLLLPSLTSAQEETLTDLNVEHLSGTLQDFTTWLNAEFPHGLTRDQILTERTPILAFFNERKPSSADLEAFEAIEIISRSTLPSARQTADLTSSTVDFYKGFKPTWSDIVSSIPAELDNTNRLVQLITEQNDRLIVLYGPMGSGKTTTLMQAAVKISDAGHSVYYIRESTDNLRAIVDTLEKVHSLYFLFIERVSRVDRQLRRCFAENAIGKGVIVCAERERAWDNQVQELLSDFKPTCIRQADISGNDADLILQKIQQFAPAVGFTGLGLRERRKLLLEHSKRQLLIGLLTATYGLGYRQMILAEFDALGREAKCCLLLVGLATQHDLPISRSIVETALREHYGIDRPLEDILSDLVGIVREERLRLYARHPVYVTEIFRSRAVRDDSEQALIALLSYFATLPQPISVHRERLGSQMVELFKKSVNHSLVSLVLKDADRVLAFYRLFERAFANDGLFWLQMGLAYRYVGRHTEALDALESAFKLHQMTHTQHALAQQKIIIASKLAVSGEPEKARVFLDEGMSTLKYLDSLDDLEGGRYYPIVALSEGHVFVTKALNGDNSAKELAKSYAETIFQRLSREGPEFRGTVAQRLNAPQVRPKKALQRLNHYALDGRWEFGSDLALIMSTDLPDAKIY